MLGGARTATRFLLVTVGIIMLTSFTIDATDGLQGSQTALSRLATQWTSASCRSGTVPVEVSGTMYCVDAFPATPSAGCQEQLVGNELRTAENLVDGSCAAVSEPGQMPWTHIARSQAATACARAGKRLLTPEEWYQAALGTPANECVITGTAPQVTRQSTCVSGSGAYDMVGNVWELLDGEVVDGRYQDRLVPATGYVSETTATGFPSATKDNPVALFTNDYFWSQATGTYAVMRGGFYGSREDAGVYSVHAAIAPTFTSQAIGFRCIYRL